LSILRFSLKFIALLSSLFLLPILTIRARPYDDSELRTLLAPDCPAPCFMHIRPGVTPLLEAIDILETHEWVSAVNHSGPENPTQIIWWVWSDKRPAFIDPLVPGRLNVIGGTADRIRVDMNVSYGEMALIVAMPDKHFLTDVNDNGICEYMTFYQQNNSVMEFYNIIRLPIKPASYWRFQKLHFWIDPPETAEAFYHRLADLPDFNLAALYRVSDYCWLRTKP
jgi:hypothetical protein